MKQVLFYFLVLLLGSESFAQPLRIAVGDDSLLAVFLSGSGSYHCNCTNPRVDGTCVYFSSGPKNIISPFYSNFRVKPDSVGHYVDTVSVSYIENAGNCDAQFYSCGDCHSRIDTIPFSVIAFSDDKIKIHTYVYNSSTYSNEIGNSVIFLYDTVKKQYLNSTILAEIYNNKGVKAAFTRWKLAFDSSQSLSMKLLQNSISVDSIVVDSARYIKNLQLVFATQLAPSFSYRSFQGAVQCHVTVAGKDSIYLLPLTFIFEPAPKSGVSNAGNNSNSLEIYPNPSSGPTHVFCRFIESPLLYLHIFDELGNDIIKLYDGVATETQKNFTIKLLPGIYHVRMQTREGVITKKVVVE
jgi:hypothetical protein